MSLTGHGPIWDDTTSPEVARLARQYESDLRARPVRRPELRDYLPGDPLLRPAALVALLRVDMADRWRAKNGVFVEWYRDRYPELDGEWLVALIYEEYCLREEAGEAPEAAEYDRRFPDVAASFRAVLEIHNLVRQGGESGPASGPGPESGTLTAMSLPPKGSLRSPLPEVGQTIAGFRLVEELGRGSFARVFRAEERQLANRAVAMKVTRTGSREPQTLARLQHTHIVPVYSYWTDAATGLHLLCMPYLGRLTLARVLGDPAIRSARSGGDLGVVLERLQAREGAKDHAAAAPVVRTRMLLGRTYASAIAWWGARLAEALAHAHDRGVLHRDVKPSNILVTDDGLPMLLDFNLAQEPSIDACGGPGGALGGTVAYMAPEQLDALAGGEAERVDARSDLYSLGVVLCECLMRGTRTFTLPGEAGSFSEAMRLAAAQRRAQLPRIRDEHPDVPTAFEAVIQHCLAPDANDRYATASDLALDLQAVADDAPLVFAREPLASRSARWLRRNRRRLAVAAPLVLALSVSAGTAVSTQMARRRTIGEVEAQVEKGTRFLADDRPDVAELHFAAAAGLAASGSGAQLRQLRDRAAEQARIARSAKDVRDQADDLFQRGERLRFVLLGFGGDPRTACRQAAEALGKFSIPGDPQWMNQPSIELLDRSRRERLRGEVNDLLFLWVLVLDSDRRKNPEMARQAVEICDAALAFATPQGPWRLLRARYAALLDGQPPPGVPVAPSGDPDERSARGCFQWGLLCDLEGRQGATIAWLERAIDQAPDDYWSQFYLGYHHARAHRPEQAQVHYEAAVALRKDSPWAWYNRALLERAAGDLDRARTELNRSLALAERQGIDFLEARLDLGIVNAGLGDLVEARAAYDAVIAAAADDPFLSRAARLNRAHLDQDSGAPDHALAEYDRLLGEDPHDIQARYSRALLALRRGQAARAEPDWTILLQDEPRKADEILARRAEAWLALGRPLPALADAASAYHQRPIPTHERLWIRTLLALGRVEELLWLKAPDDLAVLPGGDRALRADLASAAERLRLAAGVEGERDGALAQASGALLHRTRAVLLSALGDATAEAEAEVEASCATALDHESHEALLVRARVRRQAGNLKGALADVVAGLAREPGDFSLLELSGLLESATGRPGTALTTLSRASLRGAPASVHAAKARALMGLSRTEEAVTEWSLALKGDPEDPRLYLGRAAALIRLRRWARALADLDAATDWAGDHPRLLVRITLASAACLPARPDRFPRWLAQARRTWAALSAAASDSSESRQVAR
jgi:serine/threonine protein kinase/predicted Zn-dependent protease